MRSRIIFTFITLFLIQFAQATVIEQTIPQRFIFKKIQQPYSAEFPLITENEKTPHADFIDSFKAKDKEQFKILLDYDHCAQRVAYGTAIIFSSSAILKQLYTDLTQYGYFKEEVGEIRSILIVNSMQLISHKGTDNALSIVIEKTDGTKFNYPSANNSSRDQMLANELLSENCDVFTEAQMVNLILSALIEMARNNRYSSESIVNYAHQNLSELAKWYSINAPYKYYKIDLEQLDQNIDFAIQLRQRRITENQVQIGKLKASDTKYNQIRLLEDDVSRLKTLNAIERMVATENAYLKAHFEAMKHRPDYQKVDDEISDLVFKYFLPEKI